MERSKWLSLLSLFFCLCIFNISTHTNKLPLHLCRNWLRVGEGDHSRHVNGILGLLIKEKFPGMVTLGGVTEPAYTWAHYAAAPDARDREGRVFPNRAERVKAELWVSFVRTTLVNTNRMEII